MTFESKMKDFKKKHFIAILSCVLIFSLCLTGVTAYLTDADIARNKFVIGGNRIEIEEGFIPPPELKPGISFTKNVRVKNIGTSDCYVRVMAVFSNSDMEKYCEVDWNTENWVYNSEDGYWYYPKAISKGNKTPSLFTKVKIADNTPEASIEDFDIIVYAESYQSGDFKDYQSAWAHYKVNKPD